jgi:hypothetical protein
MQESSGIPWACGDGDGDLRHPSPHRRHHHHCCSRTGNLHRARSDRCRGSRSRHPCRGDDDRGYCPPVGLITVRSGGVGVKCVRCANTLTSGVPSCLRSPLLQPPRRKLRHIWGVFKCGASCFLPSFFLSLLPCP